MPKDTVRDILLRIESRLDRHDQRFDDIDLRFDGVEQRLDDHDQRFEAIEQRLDGQDRRFDEQKVQLNTLTEFTVTSLNSIDGELKTLNHRVQRLELSFESFRSDTRAYWEQLSDTRTTTAQHEVRLSRLEAG